MNIKTGTEMFGSIVKTKAVDKSPSEAKERPSGSPILLLGLSAGLLVLLYYAGKKVEENV